MLISFTQWLFAASFVLALSILSVSPQKHGGASQPRNKSKNTPADDSDDKAETVNSPYADLKQAFKSSVLAVICMFLVVLAAWRQSTVIDEESSLRQQQVSSSSHQVVVLLDVNPHQKKVLPVELAVAEGIIQRLHQPGNTFSVITFGSQTPTLVRLGVTADQAIAAILDVTLEQTREKYFSIHFYDALNFAMKQFIDNTSPKSLLVISEGNDYFPRGAFKETVARAQKLQAACDVAMVADHTFYGTKGIQRYGFDLRRLAGKTHGQYIEVGGKQKKVPRSVEKLSGSILNRGPKES